MFSMSTEMITKEFHHFKLAQNYSKELNTHL